jgi:hypothetical protein
MPLYLITEEDIDDGMWFGEPRGFPTKEAARRAAKILGAPEVGYRRVLYRCDEVAESATPENDTW